MRNTRGPLAMSLALILAATPALAQQPLQESARRASTAAAAATAQPQASPPHTAKFWTGAIVASAGGAAIVLGMTAFKTADSTSGNTPEGVYDACVAQTANPVYRNNDCGVLKGPNTGLVIGGAAAAAAGVTLMLLGRSNNSVVIGPGGFAIHRKLTF